MYRRKAALTLIEVILYLSICSIIFLSMPTTLNFIKSYKTKIDNIDVKDNVHNFLINAKILCRKEGYDGEIYFGNGKELSLYFSNILNKIEKLSFKEGYNLQFNNNEKIKINSLGIITTAGTITIKNNDEVIGKITIKVGSDIIEVKE